MDQHFDWDAAQAFFSVGHASCSSAVWQLSQVCSFVYHAVQRVLYHDVNLCTNDTSQEFSESSLSSFVRTLDQRPELAFLVRRATLRGNDSYHFDFSVIQVFTMCTNIHTLFATELDSFSELLPLFPFSNIATLAFSEVLGERTLTPFPMLRNLFIYHSGVCFTDTSSPIVPPHLENLRSYSKSLFYLGTSRRIMWTIRA